MKIQNTYKTEAIILRSYDAREYDRIYTIFSQEYGKMCVVGVGTRKPTAKLASGLEPLTKSEIFLVKGRKFDRVKGVIIHNQHQKMRKNLELLCEGKKVARIIEQLAGEVEVGEEIYHFLGKYLEFLDELGGKKMKDSSMGSAKLLQLALIWKTIKWGGHEPNLFACAHCNNRLASQDRFLFSFPEGVFCEKCKKMADGVAVNVNKDTIKLLRLFLGHEAKTILKIKCGLNPLKQASLVTRATLENLIGRKIEL